MMNQCHTKMKLIKVNTSKHSLSKKQSTKFRLALLVHQHGIERHTDTAVLKKNKQLIPHQHKNTYKSKTVKLIKFFYLLNVISQSISLKRKNFTTSLKLPHSNFDANFWISLKSTGI